MKRKRREVAPSVMIAHGILIRSRYGLADEIARGLDFAILCRDLGVAQFVHHVDFDSRSGGCSVAVLDVIPGSVEMDAIERAIHEAICVDAADIDDGRDEGSGGDTDGGLTWFDRITRPSDS